MTSNSSQGWFMSLYESPKMQSRGGDMVKGGYREGSERPVGTTGAYKTPEEKKRWTYLV